mmetsp:Transcript_19784/g.62292  ORF Transcript_19784/g.62292 Transcript_19784/m.62292 type:complete len:200 (-) Transcript_19784:424-1023(-)
MRPLPLSPKPRERRRRRRRGGRRRRWRARGSAATYRGAQLKKGAPHTFSRVERERARGWECGRAQEAGRSGGGEGVLLLEGVAEVGVGGAPRGEGLVVLLEGLGAATIGPDLVSVGVDGGGEVGFLGLGDGRLEGEGEGDGGLRRLEAQRGLARPHGEGLGGDGENLGEAERLGRRAARDVEAVAGGVQAHADELFGEE